MLQCPVCNEWKASYYRCSVVVVGRVLRAHPQVALTSNEWLLLRRHIEYDNQPSLVGRYPQDQFYIYLCHRCIKDLGFTEREMSPTQGEQCPCCGYYTLGKSSDDEICEVCYWHDDGEWRIDVTSGPNGIKLKKARANYLEFGASKERSIDHVRLPYPDEHPQYYQ